MYVTTKHHRRVVYVLIAVLIVLSVALVVVLFKAGMLKEMSGASKQSSNATSTIVEDIKKQFLHNEESVVIRSQTNNEQVLVLPIQKVLFEFVEITDGCGAHFEGECVNVRSGPGVDYPKVMQLRKSMVLKVSGKVERDGRTWYKIVFDEWLRFPERAEGEWYVASEFVHVLLDEGVRVVGDEHDVMAPSDKVIVVDRSSQTLSAYDGDDLFMTVKVSTGLELTPTPAGTFTIFKKMPSRYMQGPIDGISDDYYDLPGVPWNLYFTEDGAAIHGAYWHNDFGRKHSHGCVNLPPDKAREIYDWTELGTKVIVQE